MAPITLGRALGAIEKNRLSLRYCEYCGQQARAKATPKEAHPRTNLSVDVYRVAEKPTAVARVLASPKKVKYQSVLP
jgi:hypothetical protein